MYIFPVLCVVQFGYCFLIGCSYKKNTLCFSLYSVCACEEYILFLSLECHLNPLHLSKSLFTYTVLPISPSLFSRYNEISR